jgi:hypothetical protein
VEKSPARKGRSWCVGAAFTVTCDNVESSFLTNGPPAHQFEK